MNFTRNATSQLLTAGAMFALQFGTGVLLARLLTVADRGLYGLVLGLGALLMTFGQMGWSSAVIYRICRVGRPPEQVLSAGLWALAGTLVVCVAVGLGFDEFFTGEMLAGGPYWMLLVALALAAVGLGSRLFSAAARALDRFGLQNRIRVWGGVVTPLALALALVASDGHVAAALITVLAIRLFFVVVLGVGVVRETGLVARPERGEIRAGFAFGLKSSVPLMAGQLHRHADLFMLAALLDDPAPAALYAIAVGLAQMPGVIIEAVATALLPKLATLPNAEAVHFTARVTRHATMVSGLIAAGMMLVGPFLLPLIYGQAYADAVVPLLFLAPAFVPLTWYRMLARYYTASNRQRVTAVAQLVSVALNIALNFALIPTHGVDGAAFASLCSYGLAAVLVVYVFLKDSKLRLRDLFGFTREDLEFYLSRVRRVRS